MSHPLVSVIIPTYNRRAMVVRLIKSIYASVYKNLEVIVVDDASTDGTSEFIKKSFPQNKTPVVIRNKNNLFSAGSRNTGIRNATGTYLLFIDDDNVIDKNAITELVKQFEKERNIGELGLVIYCFSDKNKIEWLRTTRNMMTSRTYQWRNLEEFSHVDSWETADVPNAFMVRTDVIKKNHLSFCQKLGIMYEESDLSYRIRNAGYKIKVVKRAKVYHDNEGFSPDGKRIDYMYHFMSDDRRPYVFARNRIIFHSLYSNRVSLLFIISFWIWVFTLYFLYNIFSYSGAGNFTLSRRIYLAGRYLRGNLDGILFVIRKEKLSYS
jgi:GT2 family glycosyltransferase